MCLLISVSSKSNLRLIIADQAAINEQTAIYLQSAILLNGVIEVLASTTNQQTNIPDRTYSHTNNYSICNVDTALSMPNFYANNQH